MAPEIIRNLFSLFIFRLLVGYILWLIPSISLGQDLIVTNKGDSIHCQITEIKPDYIKYIHVKDDEVAKSFIPAAWVISYKQAYFSYSEVAQMMEIQSHNLRAQRMQEYKTAQERKLKRRDVHDSWLISAGWSKRMADLENRNFDEEDLAYAKALQSGWNIGVDFRFPISPRYSYGLKYNAFFSTHDDDFVIIVPPGWPPRTRNMKSTVWIHYLAPTFNTTIPNSDSTRALMLGFGVGYLMYKETIGDQPPVKISGNHFGFSLDLGYEFGLQKVISPFVRLSFCIGNIVSANFEQGPFTDSRKLNVPENLSRIDISVGVKLNNKD